MDTIVIQWHVNKWPPFQLVSSIRASVNSFRAVTCVKLFHLLKKFNKSVSQRHEIIAI